MQGILAVFVFTGTLVQKNRFGGTFEIQSVM